MTQVADILNALRQAWFSVCVFRHKNTDYGARFTVHILKKDWVTESKSELRGEGGGARGEKGRMEETKGWRQTKI